MKRGNTADIYNHNHKGRFHEGVATLVEKIYDLIDDDREYWEVHFNGDPKDVTYSRVVLVNSIK